MRLTPTKKGLIRLGMLSVKDVGDLGTVCGLAEFIRFNCNDRSLLLLLYVERITLLLIKS